MSTRINEDLRSCGIFVAPAVFSQDEVAELKHFAGELTHDPQRFGARLYLEPSWLRPGESLPSRIEEFYRGHEGLRDVIDGPKVRGLAACVMGEEVRLFKEKLHLKLPGGYGFRAHQDHRVDRFIHGASPVDGQAPQSQGWSAYADLFLTVVVALDATTALNGCLEFAKRPTDDAGHPRILSPAELDDQEFCARNLEAGDVLCFDSFVPHRSGPNRSLGSRRALYLTFNRSSDGTLRERYFLAKLREQQIPEWFRSDQVRSG